MLVPLTRKLQLIKHGANFAILRWSGLLNLLDTLLTPQEQCGGLLFLSCCLFYFFILEYVATMFVYWIEFFQSTKLWKSCLDYKMSQKPEAQVSSKSYHSSIHEESSFPAELLHRQLQHSGLRDGAFVDVQSALKMEMTHKKGRLREHISNTVYKSKQVSMSLPKNVCCTSV